MILALDLSTTCSGFTIMDKNRKIIACEAIKLDKFNTFHEKIDYMEDKLREICASYDVDHIAIEEPVKMFTKNQSSATTILLLTKFNGIISWICHKIFDVEPEYFVASSARKICGIKVIDKTKTKETILEFVANKFDDFKYELTPKGNPKPGTFDRSDSVVIALAASIRKYGN